MNLSFKMIYVNIYTCYTASFKDLKVFKLQTDIHFYANN